MAQIGHHAVLTGDIIGSTRLLSSQLKSVRLSIVHAVGVVRRWKRGLVKGGPVFFRGDGWQLLLADPAMALRVAIFLRASLLAGGLADSRIAIGLGKGDASAFRKIAWAMGQAFVLSGHALDEMTHYSNMTIGIPSSAGPLSEWLPVVGHLCDSLIGQWTRRQAEVVCAAIDPKDPGYEEVAQSLKPRISKQAVAKGLRGANWHVIREAIHRFEQTDWGSVLPPAGFAIQKRLSHPRQPKKVVSSQTTKKG